MIPIYRAEVDAGLKDSLAIAHTQALCSLKGEIPEVTLKKLQVNLKERVERAFGAAQDQFDLFPIYTVLVSTGWNKNDDVFGKAETWKARYTPEDKPFNLEHEPSKIIGHITASCAVDDAFLPIDDNTVIDDLPSKYHILTSAVVYRAANNRNKEWTEATNKLIQEIQDGKWCVSMECLFNDFDYAMADADGKHTIVNRNEDTAFLTKHLRMYGGEGTFNDQKVGRYLKNITFSGKGLTEHPANPDSVIFTDTSLFDGVFAGANILENITPDNAVSDESGVNNNSTDLKNEETKMPDEKVTALETENTDLKAQIAKLTEEKAALADIQKQIDELTASIKIKDEELVKASEGVAAKEATLAQTVEEMTALKAEFEKLKAAKLADESTISSLSTSVTKANRTISLYAYELDPVEINSIVDKFISVSDEQFNDMVALIAKKKNGKEMKEEKEEKKEGCASEEVKKDESHDAVASAEAVKSDEIPGQVANEDVNDQKKKVEVAKASVREFFSNVLSNKTKKVD